MRTLGISPEEYEHAVLCGTISIGEDGLVRPESIRRLMLGTGS